MCAGVFHSFCPSDITINEAELLITTAIVPVKFNLTYYMPLHIIHAPQALGHWQ